MQDVLDISAVTLGEPPAVRDWGLLESAVGRPRSTVFGEDPYPTLMEKAAALMHSLAANHALVDGNKRTAWAAAMVFLDLNGCPLLDPLDEDAAEELVLAAAQSLVKVGEIAAGLAAFVVTRS